MGKKKAEENKTFNNTFDYKTAPVTPQTQAVFDMKAAKDPTIPYRYANMKKDYENSFNNPLGAYTTPAVREAANRSFGQHLAMDEAQANQKAQFNADNTNYARAVTEAQMTAPQLIQSRGNSTATTTESGGLLGNILGGVAGIGLNYATGGASGAASSKLGKAKHTSGGSMGTHGGGY